MKVLLLVLMAMLGLILADTNYYNVEEEIQTSVGIFSWSACENFASYGEIIDDSSDVVSGATRYSGSSNITKLIRIPHLLTNYCVPNWLYMTCNFGLMQVISGTDCSRDFEAFTVLEVMDSYALLAQVAGLVEITPGKVSAAATSGSGSVWVMEQFGTFTVVSGLADSETSNAIVMRAATSFASLPFRPGTPDGIIGDLHTDVDPPLTTWFLRCGGEVFCGAMIAAFQVIDERDFVGDNFAFTVNYNHCHSVVDPDDSAACGRYWGPVA